ncbi:MAG: GTP-binding protein [bacterium]
MRKIPITVFTGYLGSGKTTIIFNLIKSLPKDYKSVWLKNEFGDIKIDSELAKANNIEVKEMVNGCLCCVLVGKLGDAIKEIIESYNPDRVIIETSGSAYPAPIAWEIRKLEKEANEGKTPYIPHLDSIITVIDAINFNGYRDKSYTAKLQAEFTDLILINKSELVKEEDLDKTLDDVYDLNPTTPKIKTINGSISPDLVFGIDTKLFNLESEVKKAEEGIDPEHQEHELDILEFEEEKEIDIDKIEQLLKELPSKYFYRIKGVVLSKEPNKSKLINYVFGRIDIQTMNTNNNSESKTKMLFLGKNLSIYKEKIENELGIKTNTNIEVGEV